MKLLHIAAIGHHAEGIGSVLKDLVPHQISSGVDVKIFSLKKNVIYDSLPIETIKGIDDFKQKLEYWVPDFVLFHSVYKKEYILIYKYLKKRGIPYGVQMHGCLSEENYKKNHLKKFIANFLYFNKFLSSAKKIIYLSEAEKKRCVINNINSNSLIIPNGTTLQKVDFSTKLEDDVIEIIFVGRISLQVKGLDKLLAAIDILGNRKDVHFSIYGNEDDIHTQVLKETIRGKEGLIDYRGPAYGEKKNKVMRESNIFILTSPSEGMPMGVLDALSFGIPCIVTPGTNMGEVVKKNHAGWLARYDSEDIANIIQQALTEYRNKQIEFRQNAYELSKNYSWDNVATLSIESIKQIIS